MNETDCQDQDNSKLYLSTQQCGEIHNPPSVVCTSQGLYHRRNKCIHAVEYCKGKYKCVVRTLSGNGHYYYEKHVTVGQKHIRMTCCC